MQLKVKPVYDAGFRPIVRYMEEYERDAASAPHKTIAISVVRNKGYVHTIHMDVFEDGIDDARSCEAAERTVKTLLWVCGGHRIIISGSRPIYEYIAGAYAPDGARGFDNGFMSGVYETEFAVEYRENVNDAPGTSEASSPVGRHMNGCRIGFDAGGSDVKVSAVVDGESIYSEEIIWQPKKQTDPAYHYQGIKNAMLKAKEKLPHLDGIGVSSAGVYIDNRAMVASLFMSLSEEDKKKCRNIYLDVAKEIGDVPVEVANDGDVTALAGAIELDDNNILGIAMGTSEAGGYVDKDGYITGWLNELAFVPVDMNPNALVDEWSGDVGCGVKYFSQDAVIKLCPAAGIELDDSLTLAEKLKYVQELHAAGDKRTEGIYQTIGVYFGYQIAYYARFYDIKHVLIMGRVTSGTGGQTLLATAREVLKTEYPELAERIVLHIPDESSRRVGQSVAAASLPYIG
ncbi:MAG: ROK family protein [Clostridia bacterium]|nr:ROK family protein [Clostridia bacterium]